VGFVGNVGETPPRNCYFIDYFPLSVKDFEKYQQVEIYYDLVLNKEMSEDTYKAEGRKKTN